VWLLVLAMSEETLASLRKKEKDFSHVVAMDMNVNRLAHLILRLLNKRGAPNASSVPVLYYCAAQLESLGDSYKQLAQQLTKNSGKLELSTAKLLGKVHSQLRASYELFFNFTAQGASSLDKECRLLEQEFEGLSGTQALFFAEQISRKITEITRNYFVIFV